MIVFLITLVITNKFYIENSKRLENQKSFENFSEFLKSLKMKANITRLKKDSLKRANHVQNSENICEKRFDFCDKKYFLNHPF